MVGLFVKPDGSNPPKVVGGVPVPTADPTKTLAGQKPQSPPPVVAASPIIPPAFSRFDKAIRFTMENEDGVRWDHDKGEFTNNPKDPGGATKWGVIKTEYEKYLGRTLTVDEVKLMPRETAVAIYQEYFWQPVAGNSYMSDTSAMAVFDTAVNKGLGGAKVILTDACHGHFVSPFGADGLAAVNKFTDQEFLNQMQRATYNYIYALVQRHPNVEWAQKGWLNRADKMQRLLTWSASA